MQLSFYVKKLAAMIRDVSAETDYSRPALLWAYTLAFLRCGVSIDEFRICRLYDYSGHVQAKHFMTSGRSIRAGDMLCRNATQEELDSFGKKERFNALFSDRVRRDWVFAQEADREELRAFLDRNDTFLAKETESTQGKNITLWRAGEFDPEAFLDEYTGSHYVLEAFIRQHPAMSSLNPTSVNTVRLITAGYRGRITIIGGCLRTGGVSAFVDNFHSGGIAFPLDLSSGIVSGPGRDFAGKRYIRHPATDAVVPGFTVPHWDVVTAAVTEAAARIPNVGYIGWDVAVTEDGVEFVEGNVCYPDHTLIQIDRVDAWKRVRDFMKECDAGA